MFLLISLLLLLTPEKSLDLGLRVWQNECAGTVEGLTSWNEREGFASLGIGHFIWYPKNKAGPFVETFPRLLKFLESKEVALPRWLLEADHCPWKTRLEFQQEKSKKRMIELRGILKKTVALQAEFLALRLEEALPLLLARAEGKEGKAKIQARFEQLAKKDNGLYALLDYVNFKGYGTLEEERYLGNGWGLFQVLDGMSDDAKKDPVDEFVRSAKDVLQRRVEFAPSERNERFFLVGWLNRVDSYQKKKS
jgi:hypothetical protein